jgi:shikimate dehydrogenase
MTAKAGVVGWPIAHSLSPVLHGHWLKEYGIDGTYEKIAIEPGTFPQRIAELRAAGFRGVNVTVPYKEEAFALADRKHQAATVTGAANLLFVTPFGDLGANNTDASGLFDSLEAELGRASLGGKNIVVLGAGGAARGATFGLQHFGSPAKITILNRNKERADKLTAHLSRHLPLPKFVTGGLEDWQSAAADAWLVVNTTSAGMKGNPPLGIDLGVLPKAAVVCDIVYNPLMTPLLKDADARGHRIVDGLGMLMHQAAPSFQVFFDKEMGGQVPKVTSALRAALVKELQARG